jgi:hypothetical protein
MKTLHFITDEQKEEVNAFCFLNECINKVRIYDYYWKWAIIALHNGLQNLMVCALRSTHGIFTMRPKTASKFIKEFVNGKITYFDDLDNFLNLYEKIKTDVMVQTILSNKFEGNSMYDECMLKLNNVRNDFIHFIPRTLIVPISDLPLIFDTCIQIASFLIKNSGNIIWQYESEYEQMICSQLDSIVGTLNELKNEYESTENENEAT